MLHPSVCGPPLDPLQQVHVFPVLGSPELDAVLQVGSHESGGEGQNPLPRPASHASFDAAQDTVGFLGCKRRAPNTSKALLYSKKVNIIFWWNCIALCACQSLLFEIGSTLPCALVCPQWGSW